jgi:ABC-type multidrug transport system ATPase subunit
VPGPVLVATGVTKRIGTKSVLAGVDVEVQEGERLAILGANGSGKTTLLRLLAGITRATAGTIKVLGQDPQSDGAIRARIGTLLHEAALYPDLTVEEQASWWMQVQGCRGTAPQLLADHHLAGLAATPIGALSRGQRQRVALALAFAGPPAILLLDEPFTALDSTAQARLEALLRDGPTTTCIFTTHDQALARRLATKVVRLHAGRLEAA